MIQLNLFATIGSIIGIAGLFMVILKYMTDGMREQIKDLQVRMLKCETARDDLSRQNLELLKELVKGQKDAASEFVKFKRR